MKKYKVTQRFMNELNEWKQANFNDGFMFVNEDTISDFSEVIDNWWHSDFNYQERNKRLVAIINWVNGEDAFEVGAPTYIVQRKGNNLPHLREYISIDEYGLIDIDYVKARATRFDDFTKASEWANKHFEVVGVDE